MSDINNMSIGQLNDYLTDKIVDMVDTAHEDLLHLANVVSSATSMETSDTSGATLDGMTTEVPDGEGVKTVVRHLQDGDDANALNSLAEENGYKDWNAMADDFNKFGMGRSLGGLTAGSPIQIQAIQSEIQTVVDAGTAVAKAKETMQKKIGQMLLQGAS